MAEQTGRNWARVDLAKIEHNYHVMRGLMRPGCRYLAVVKANAYGHGAVPVARTLEAVGADWFAVATLEEAAQLRCAGISLPILILGWTDPRMAGELARLDITQAVFSGEYGRSLAEQARRAGAPVQAHIKLDTGMHRIGFRPQEDGALETVAALYRERYLRCTGIFTHFAVSCDANEEADRRTKEQFVRFTGFIGALRERGIDPGICHCCNSAAIVRFPEMQLDMARVGIIGYGLAPSDDMRACAPVQPALSLHSRIVQLAVLPAGDGIGYGLTCASGRERLAATVPIGYADGYLRAWGCGKACALVRGRRAALLGRVCMDQLMLDVTDIPQVCVGDTVTLVGEDGGEQITFDGLAELAGTIGYECVCGVSSRVPRVYLRGEAPERS